MLLFLPRHRLVVAQVSATAAFPMTADTTGYVRHAESQSCGTGIAVRNDVSVLPDSTSELSSPVHVPSFILMSQAILISCCFIAKYREPCMSLAEYLHWLVRVAMQPQLENLRDSIAESIEGQVGDRMQIQLAHDVGAMGFSRLYAEIQSCSYFLARFSLRQKLQHLPLSGG